MKKSLIKLSLFLTVVCALIITTSCSSDDDSGVTPPPSSNNALVGTIDEDLTLDPTVQYTVAGEFFVTGGATLTIPAGTKIVSETGTDHYIAIDRGAKIDVQGTAANPVTMTSVNETPGDWGGLVILGDATTTAGLDVIAEVGGFVYGGTNDTDNSGSIKYLIINYAGAQIKPESQYNGLTLYSVGSGTTIDNVAILNGTDDGVEFFGGTVSATNLYLENNEDDAVDWTEGWNGTVENTYVLHAIEGFSTAIEADGDNNNPQIINFTAVSTTGGTALQFKKQSGATITGLSLIGYTTSIDRPDDSALTNIQIEGADADPYSSYTTEASVDVSAFAWVKSGTTISEDVLQGVLESEVTLDASVSYKLNSSFIVKDGGKLIIPAGTKITAASGGTSVYIAVLKGGQIDIQGTPENPVVMASETAQPGDWGGLTICGNATTTEGVDAIAEIGGFVYGGTDDTDSSGSITNLVIIGTGAQINSESQYNGVSFYAVGSGTTVENIAVKNGADDGVEFFGGTVSATNLYLENNEDDAVDWTEGWNGTVTNTYVSHTVAGFSTALEADGINNDPQLVNFTAISTVDGTALQFKKQSGAGITNLYLSGYATQVDMVDGGALSNVQIDGAVADPAGDYTAGTQVDITGWSWINASL
ncbi:hypothetical protein [Galbibacter sp.]|uniref:hypothetical protein n=1 Tax=Galbibacter sp. TaxID=2918471 RepID=UPI003A953031